MKHLMTVAGLLAMSAQTIFAGEVTGKVTLKGTPPAEIKLPLDPVCGKLNNNQPVTTRHYLVAADGGLANVWIFVKNPPAGKAAGGDQVVLDQVNCLYQPYVMGIGVGQKLVVRNSDPFLHNVNTTASAVPSHRFNIAQPMKGKEDVKTFEKPELPLKFMCNVHQWMLAYAGVFDHPYYTVTDKDGKFKLPDLPAGKYTIVAKHMKAGEKTQEITVDGNKTADFTLEVPAAPK